MTHLMRDSSQQGSGPMMVGILDDVVDGHQFLQPRSSKIDHTKLLSFYGVYRPTTFFVCLL